MTEGTLATRWRSAADAAGARGDVAGAGARLLVAWAQPHRWYHDQRHLQEVLEHLDELAGVTPVSVAGPNDPVTAARLAAWFHDAVYERAPDDEAASARWAASELAALGVGDGLVAEVVRLVLLTTTHDPPPGDVAGELLSDADLGVLAADPGRYGRYAADVRREWRDVPDADFAAGRVRVLRTLLSHERLFRSPGALAWEQRARANLAAELRSLGDEG